MNKLEYQAELFTNRLRKRYKELRKWARKNRISCYRLYDRDIPEVPVSLDLYEFLPDEIDTPVEAARFLSDQNARLSANDPDVEAGIKERTYAVLYLYERPYEKDETEEEIWLDLMAKSAAEILGIPDEHIVKKSRGHKSHKDDDQYKKVSHAELVSASTLERSRNKFGMTEGLTQEQGQIFRLNLTSYLDTGLFFDHRPLRSIVRDTCS